MLQDTDFENKVFILQDRVGDFVSQTESTGFETSKIKFTFTKDKNKAKHFTWNDLYSRLETTPLGIEFSRGYCGKVIRVK